MESRSRGRRWPGDPRKQPPSSCRADLDSARPRPSSRGLPLRSLSLTFLPNNRGLVLAAEEPRSWLAAEEATSWIPECEVCRKALSFGDGRDPVVSMALDKQEETVRESRYFTALKAINTERGEGSRVASGVSRSRSRRLAAPGAEARSPAAPSQAPRPALPRGRAAERTAPSAAGPSRPLPSSRRPGALQMQREAAFRPGHCHPLRIMGSVDQGNCARPAPDVASRASRPRVSAPVPGSAFSSGRRGQPGTPAWDPASPGHSGRVAGEGRPRSGQGGRFGKPTSDDFARGQGSVPRRVSLGERVGRTFPATGHREGSSLLTAGCLTSSALGFDSGCRWAAWFCRCRRRCCYYYY